MAASRIHSRRSQLEREAILAILTESEIPMPTSMVQDQLPGTKPSDVYRFMRAMDEAGAVLWMATWTQGNSLAWWTTPRVVVCRFCETPCELKSGPSHRYGYEGHDWNGLYISPRHADREFLTGFWSCEDPACSEKAGVARMKQYTHSITGRIQP